MGVKEAEPITMVENNAAEFILSTEWNDRDNLLIEGRKALLDAEKQPNDNRYFSVCYECNLVFRKEADVWIELN